MRLVPEFAERSESLILQVPKQLPNKISVPIEVTSTSQMRKSDLFRNQMLGGSPSITSCRFMPVSTGYSVFGGSVGMAWYWDVSGELIHF